MMGVGFRVGAHLHCSCENEENKPEHWWSRYVLNCL